MIAPSDTGSRDSARATARRALPRPSAVLRVAIAMSAALWLSPVSAQVAEQIVVTSHDGVTGEPTMRRFDRRLNLLGSTQLNAPGAGSLDAILTEVVVHPDGKIWMTIDDLNNKLLMRLGPDGALLPSALLNHNPVSLTASATGEMFALTRVPIFLEGPVYGVGADGTILWDNIAGPTLFGFFAPDEMAVTSTGQLWIGSDSDVASAGATAESLLVWLDKATGDVLRTLAFVPVPGEDSNYWSMAASPDGAIWSGVSAPGIGAFIVKSDEDGVLSTSPILSIFNGATHQIRVDADGDVWAVSGISESFGGLLRRFSQVDGSLLEEHDAGGNVFGFALGPTGEELYTVVNEPFVSGVRRLVRINRVTGRRSTLEIQPPHGPSGIGNGDPTGFVLANVVDQDGDADGDGATNRSETLAGSSPYDPLSRPEGPKVSIDFTASNAIVLIFKDPDGLVDPVSGLDLSALSLTAGSFGEIFSFLLSFLTFVDVSADGTEATAIFGGLPLASGLKIPLEARVADLTGAEGWDWQVTPPGDL